MNRSQIVIELKVDGDSRLSLKGNEKFNDIFKRVATYLFNE